VKPLAGRPAVAPAGAEAVEARQLAQVFRALRHRNFRLFCLGQLISLSGAWMQSVAQTWLVYRLTRSELLVGLTNFCLQLPVFALAPLGGVFSDRHSRRRLVAVTQALSMGLALALAALTLWGRVEVWQVLALAAALGCVNAFDIPARQAFLVQMTSPEDLLNAIALNSSIFNFARVAGPGIAGLLVARFGEGVCFAVNGLSFVPVIASLAAMRLPRFERTVVESPWEHLLEGFRYAYRTLHIRYLLLLLAAATISGAPAYVLMPFFAAEILGRGSEGMGLLLASMGIGALIGTLVLAGRATTRGLTRVVLFGAAGFGASLILFAASRHFLLSLVIMFGAGFSALRHLASTNTLIQTLIPDDYRGRIMALYTMTVVGLAPFASLAGGAAAHRVGPPATVAAAGVLCVLASLAFRARLAELERSVRGELRT